MGGERHGQPGSLYRMITLGQSSDRGATKSISGPGWIEHLARNSRHVGLVVTLNDPRPPGTQGYKHQFARLCLHRLMGPKQCHSFLPVKKKQIGL